MNIQTISALATLFSAGVSVFAIVLGLIQVFQLKLAKFAELRPYVEVQYSANTEGTKTRVYLELRNVGKTPARNIQIRFSSMDTWNHISIPDYPFLSESGIHQLQIGETLRYFVGELGTSAKFDAIQSTRISIQISYQTVFNSKKILDKTDISLSHLRYSKSLKPKGSK